MGKNLDAVRAAVVQAKELAAEFRTGEATFFHSDGSVAFGPVSCRVKKPKPSSFDAGNQTEWSKKRSLIIKIGQNEPGVAVIDKGLIVQVSTPDGDPTINHINFTVQSALDSQFSAERNISVESEILETPRIPTGP